MIADQQDRHDGTKTYRATVQQGKYKQIGKQAGNQFKIMAVSKYRKQTCTIAQPQAGFIAR